MFCRVANFDIQAGRKFIFKRWCFIIHIYENLRGINLKINVYVKLYKFEPEQFSTLQVS